MTESQVSPASVQIQVDRCKGCYLCVDACPRNVLKRGTTLNDLGYYHVYYVGYDCTGCGLCFYSCPEPAAIRVFRRGANP